MVFLNDSSVIRDDYLKVFLDLALSQSIHKHTNITVIISNMTPGHVVIFAGIHFACNITEPSMFLVIQI